MKKWLFLSAFAYGLFPTAVAGYSVLTHQANIDACWQASLVPLLSARYPGATPVEWQAAKANAYGGSIIQDMGYYPFSSKLFTNLTHYVRAGDFVRSLLDEAHDRNEYAFALGALAHYVADSKGHAEGTNRAMPSVYPKLATEFGPIITYEEAPAQHVQLEFGFDVVMLATGRYQSSQYHDFIGFAVNKPVLERAFRATYGLELRQVLPDADLSIGSFRFTVMRLIPLGSRAAWQMERKNILRRSPRARRREYVFRQSPRAFRREYKVPYQRPGFAARLLAGLVRVLPKIGPLRTLAFHLPTPAAQVFFQQSLLAVRAGYERALAQEQQATPAHPPVLPNCDLDTGRPTTVGEYALADDTYAEWLRQLAHQDFAGVTTAQKQALLGFFGGPAAPPAAEAAGADERKTKDQATTRVAFARLLAFEPDQPH